MVRTITIAAFWTLMSASAQAGSFTCTQSETASAADIVASPKTYVGKCLRVRGTLSAAPKVGAMLTPATGRVLDELPGYISIYFESETEPDDLMTRPRYAEIVGRLLTCDDIGRNAVEAADRANKEEAAHPPAAGTSEIFHIGMVMGTCHYRDDAFAILISSYKLLPAPPG
jgi:hypothetical protein